MRLSTALTICGLLVLGLTTTAFYSLSVVVHPETRLAGNWEEVAWSYEKADPAAIDQCVRSFFNEQLRSEISRDLIIHGSETWSFREDRMLVLRRKDASDTRPRWNLKGRGHVLEIIHEDGRQEHYRIRELTDQRLVLHFNNDMIVRGIVKIEFRRTHDPR